MCLLKENQIYLCINIKCKIYFQKIKVYLKIFISESPLYFKFQNNKSILLEVTEEIESLP